jgi:rhodanese-related sulfurtransferase
MVRIKSKFFIKGELMSKLLIINALAPEYYNDCHIAGSINVPLAKLEEYAKTIAKDTEIVVYCARYECSVSRNAWHLLKKLGFTNIVAYEGGMAEWKKKGYPSKGACKLEYLQEENKPKEFDKSVKTIMAEQLLQKLKK